jgi:hypothetical protein
MELSPQEKRALVDAIANIAKSLSGIQETLNSLSSHLKQLAPPSTGQDRNQS